ncbi:2-dehydro-3-deoxy-6-phosphogalactonate aldolase [Colwellia sp. MB3u-70]|uniref:2-dehydro-3-deoxy-6-phosphogalactonate aldolase n=1 Tax=unclassified Colwellia TaxID=196834 RepID=UPI0015F626F7|nr:MULTISPECIES: 2-dehydro-3-deoxy-6-phosphogalactonate aldolase [unclassified Colwellia]MBA6291108.1 2-dehydro-3-deoxy-6-phosphogalactonate aldolase [Colwellia sp. MB3u-8]MBA6308173.1 2-dehydro-3-deoxy-6-phosphogalactonate aldolase [Colwellia sp. MB3u-70]
MEKYIKKHPVIAILRGITPEAVVEIAQCLYAHGIRVIEVPLNSPQAIKSIEKLVNALPDDCLIGAGTVFNIEQVIQIENVGGKLIVSPHCDPDLIQYCQSKNLHVIAGVATPTEAILAYQAGARWLKLFPAQTYGFSHVKALKSVLPNDVHIIPVGGVSQSNVLQWLSSGASALGFGSSLYQSNDSLDETMAKVIKLNKVLNITPNTNINKQWQT